jgi:hypothetical protein
MTFKASKLIVFYTDNVDNTEYLDKRDGGDRNTTIKNTIVDLAYRSQYEEKCINIATNGIMVVPDSGIGKEYIPPHRIEKIKIIGD